ncbi:MAG: lactonase family protein, partial [Sphingobacterium sp.]
LGTDGAAPCHVLLGGEDRYAVVSNYVGGALNLYALAEDGEILSKDDTKMYHGSSVDSNRQKESHIHSAFMGPDELIYVSDLGADQIYCLQVESKDGKFQFVTKDSIQTPAGGGPRHLAFHPKKDILYSLMEMTGDVVVFQKEANKWVNKQVINMNADDFQGENGAADIKVSADGKFVYATNRVDANSITCFQVKEDGGLAKIQVTSVLGKGPRSFNFTPDEQYILVANQLSDEVVIFDRDQETGLLTDSHKRIDAYKPVSVVF